MTDSILIHQIHYPSLASPSSASVALRRRLDRLCHAGVNSFQATFYDTELFQLNFQSLEVVDRGSDSELQVTENA